MVPVLTAVAGHARAPGRIRPRAGRLRLVLLLVAVTLITGCAIRLAYNQLDWLTVWYLRGYVDLDRSQEQLLREVVARQLDRHRATQLPVYAGLLRQLRADLSLSWDPSLVERRFHELSAPWFEFRDSLAPDAALLLRTLTDQQVADLLARLEEKNSELAAEYSGSSPDQRRNRQTRAALSNIRRITGRLSAEQEELIRTRVAELHDLAEDWLERRRRWQAEFGRLMAAERDGPEFEARLGALLGDPDQFDEADYRRQVAENRVVIFAMVADTVNSLTARQRVTAARRLESLARDLDVLAAASAG